MIHTIELTGAGTTLQIQTASQAAQWVEVFGLAANGASFQTGGPSVSSSVGRPVAKGTGFLYPPVFRGGYDLNEIYNYIAMSDKVEVTYEDFA